MRAFHIGSPSQTWAKTSRGERMRSGRPACQASVGVATYRLTQALLDALKGSLPRIEELEATLRKADAAAQAEQKS